MFSLVVDSRKLIWQIALFVRLTINSTHLPRVTQQNRTEKKQLPDALTLHLALLFTHMHTFSAHPTINGTTVDAF